jgi:serine/threonine-protein kinase RsbW
MCRDEPHSDGVVPSSDALRRERHDIVGGRDRHDVFRLPARRASVADARCRIRERLAEWDADPELCDDASLVVTELFTNAVRHTDSEKITCVVRQSGAVVRLEITDQGRGSQEPAPCDASMEAEGGRGLLLVSVLALAWGSVPGEDGTGRVVWAELAAHHAPSD